MTGQVSAWQQGRDAFEEGKKRNRNPYHYQRPEHEQWLGGWDEAAQEANSDATAF